MKVLVLGENGIDWALLGISLSYNQDSEAMMPVAKKLAHKQGGHNKFLESIMVWLDVDAPRYWWQQFDTYRVGVTKQSESTMHTMTKRPLIQDDFEYPIPDIHLVHLNSLINAKNWEQVKRDLPESFKQRRIVCLSYAALQRVVSQRKTHRLTEWVGFIREILAQVQYREFLIEETT